jgi:hypothetical protein
MIHWLPENGCSSVPKAKVQSIPFLSWDACIKILGTEMV